MRMINSYASFFVVLFFTFITNTVLSQDSSLDAKVGNYTSYRFEDKRIRHHRYEFELLQKTKIHDHLNTVAEGRYRFDAALYPGTRSSEPYSADVRDDEMSEGSVRQMYLDYFYEDTGLKVGIQQINWIDTLSPRINDMIAPLDIRHGGNGNSSEIIEPVFAVDLNRGTALGQFNLLLVPLPKLHTLPRAENGYGFYDRMETKVRRRVPGAEFDYMHPDEIPERIDQVEGGLRWMLNINSWDLMALAFRGHQRTPAIELQPTAPQAFDVYSRFPSSNTFGFTAVTAGDNAVLRLLSYYEPKRAPDLFYRYSSTMLPYRRYYETRTRLGFGFDYLFNQHLKFYSEHFYVQDVRSYEKSSEGIESLSASDKQSDTVVSIYRLTNETFDDVVFTLDGSFSRPRFGYSISPEMKYKFLSSAFIVGRRWYGSSDVESPFEGLDKTEDVYAKIETYFSL